MQQHDINKDFRVLFGDIFIVPFLGLALRYLTAQCAAWGEEIWLHLNGMICPWAGTFDCKFWKKVKSPPHALPPPPPPPPALHLYIDRCIKTNTSKFQFDLERTDMFQQVLMNSCVLPGKQITIILQCTCCLLAGVLSNSSNRDKSFISLSLQRKEN